MKIEYPLNSSLLNSLTIIAEENKIDVCDFNSIIPFDIEVEFKSGKKYLYMKVPQNIIFKVLNSSSKGIKFKELIIDNYKFIKI